MERGSPKVFTLGVTQYSQCCLYHIINVTIRKAEKVTGPATIAAAAAAAAPKPKVDAFTKYSSNLIRMRELLLLGDDSNEDDDEDLDYLAPLNDALRHASISGQVNGRNNNGGDASKRRRGNDSRPIPQQGFLDDLERKTRLSFELHPSLLLHDLMHQDVDMSAHISDDEDEDDEKEE
jgi:hypothetical protein